MSPVDVLTKVISEAHGEKADPVKSRAQATAALKALNEAGYVVLPHADAKRAAHRVPNGFGEPTIALHDRLMAALWEQRP